MPKPTRPTQLSAYAEATLKALADASLGHKLSLGGALGLLHYHEYRFTHDVDAWWEPATTAEEKEAVLGAVENALRPFGSTRLRHWGEVSSLELRLEGKTRLQLPDCKPLDPDERATAANLRHWFAQEFLDALMD